MKKGTNNPKDIAALKALAENLHSLGRPKDALQYLVKAVMLQPENAQLVCDLADMWQAAGYLPQAAAAYQKALELSPYLPRALYSLGCVHIAAGEYPAAISCLETAVETKPDWLEARHNLARALYEMGQVSSAFAHFERCAAMTQRKESEHSRSMAAVIAPGVPELDNQSILKTRRAWTERDLPVYQERELSNPDYSKASLRIGYLSSFFHGDNWMKPVWGLLNQHDRKQFNVHLFSDSPAATSSSLPYGYQPHSEDKFHKVTGMSNEQVARLIRDCGIDIIVDLNGYSRVQRMPLFASHPAPLVVGWFNSYGTTAIAAFDLLIGDHHVIPIEEECFYSEKIERVSGSWLTFEPLKISPDVVDPPCSAGRSLTFGSASAQYKITNEVVKLWSRILKQSEGSSLILKNKHLGSTASRDYLHARFEREGIDRGRVQLEGPEEYQCFLQFYARIDVALETFPYGGATTTTDALWQGVPVIASEGDRWASRLSVSVLREAGLSEFVTPNLEGYVDLAVGLASSPNTVERLTELRRNMRSRLRSSNICNTSVFARQIEAIYRRCWAGRSA